MEKCEKSDNFYVVALESAVSVSKSTCIALGMLEGVIDIEKAAMLARIEEERQIKSYGKVEGSHDVDEIFVLHTLAAAKILVSLKNSK